MELQGIGLAGLLFRASSGEPQIGGSMKRWTTLAANYSNPKS